MLFTFAANEEVATKERSGILDASPEGSWRGVLLTSWVAAIVLVSRISISARLIFARVVFLLNNVYVPI